MGGSEFRIFLHHHLELEPGILVLIKDLGVCEGRMSLIRWEPEKRLDVGDLR